MTRSVAILAAGVCILTLVIIVAWRDVASARYYPAPMPASHVEPIEPLQVYSAACSNVAGLGAVNFSVDTAQVLRKGSLVTLTAAKTAGASILVDATVWTDSSCTTKASDTVGGYAAPPWEGPYVPGSGGMRMRTAVRIATDADGRLWLSCRNGTALATSSFLFTLTIQWDPQ